MRYSGNQRGEDVALQGEQEEFAPYAPGVLADPASGYRHLLEEAPVCWVRSFNPPFCILSRYDDVEEAIRDIETFSSEYGQGPRFTPPAGMLSDPPQHTFFRSLVQQAFTPKAIAAMSGRIDELSHGLLDEVAARGEWDLHDDYAFPLPVIVIAGMLGVPEGDIHRFKDWSDASVAAMGSEDPTPYVADLQAMAGYLLEQIRERRDRTVPGDDLISRLVLARESGRGLDDTEILGVVTQLLVGGNETTTSLITNAVWRLLQQPELWARFVADPALVDRIIEESLRYDPPVLGLFRNTTRDVTLHGQVIPAGTKVMLHYAAANRDPRAFDGPDHFDFDADRRRHFSFGLGVHFCLGAQLARLEARSALLTLASRFPGLELVNDGERIAPFFLWGRRRLPVRNGRVTHAADSR
jgi:cytochrome P450